MTTLREIQRLAKAMRVDLEVARPRKMLDATAMSPIGHRFIEGGGLHVLVAHQLPGLSESEVLADLEVRMREGLEVCTERDCEVCTEEAE